MILNFILFEEYFTYIQSTQNIDSLSSILTLSIAVSSAFGNSYFSAKNELNFHTFDFYTLTD